MGAKKYNMKLVELFAGIGGFTKGFIDAGYKIEEHYFSEIDKHAIANYKYNFPHAKHIGSVVDIRPEDFRNIDILTGGFPCQPFSLAGKRLGFEDTRGTMFFEIQRILMVAKPKCVVLENVKGLLNHDGGRTFATIYRILTEIGYTVECQLVNSKWFRPQNRERIYIVGHLAGRSKPGIFPIEETEGVYHKREQKEPSQIASTLNANDQKSWVGNFLLCDSGKGRQLEKRDIMPPLRANTGAGHGNYVVGTWRDYKGEVGIREMSDNLCPTLLARARADGSGQPVIKNEKSIRRLTEIECERLQGFPDNWTEYGVYEKQVWINKKEKTFKIVENVQKIPKSQRYKMLGNAVTVTVVEEIAKRITLI